MRLEAILRPAPKEVRPIKPPSFNDFANLVDPKKGTEVFLDFDTIRKDPRLRFLKDKFWDPVTYQLITTCASKTPDGKPIEYNEIHEKQKMIVNDFFEEEYPIRLKLHSTVINIAEQLKKRLPNAIIKGPSADIYVGDIKQTPEQILWAIKWYEIKPYPVENLSQ